MTMTSSQRVLPALVRKLLDVVDTIESTDFNVTELEMMDRALQNASAKLRGFRNSMQPINRLPPELLACIFSETQLRLPSFLPLPSTGFHDYENCDWREWLNLLEVCRHWRGVVASSPELWSNVCSLADAPAFIRRSHGSELTVYLGLRQFGFSSSLMNALAPHTSRFKEFHMRAKGSEDILKHQIFSSPAPRLNSLLIEAEDQEEWNSVLPPIFCGNMPKLRQLALGYFTSWPKGYFHNLTSLCLYHQRASTLPTTTEFLDFLEFSPHIEELALVRGGPIRPLGTDVAPLADRLISLKRLEKLDLGDWPSASIIARFLSHLSLSRKTAMYFWGNSFLDEENVGALLPQDTSHLHNLKGIKEWFLIRQTELPHPLGKLVSVADSTLYMTGAFLPFQIPPSAISRYRLSKVRFLRLRDDALQFTRLRVSDWKALLGLVPKVESLSIYAMDAPHCTRAVISALRPPKLFPPSLPTLDGVICPALKTVEITEETELPFLHVCSLSGERASCGAPEIHFRFFNDSLPGPRRRASPAAYESDSDSDLDYGYNVPDSGPYTQRVEYIIKKYEGRVIKGPSSWPTRAFLWNHYVALSREFYMY
ncbi:Glycosyltransferase family 49 protein [Mycena sanguinolenta]|uniref:Glycosyltransferase family 49 protein n=1 Tax=Mycena sanguinolenta TaxID=230812 RepID=A0A8H6Z9J0_9AGAR|nr:Glycosyltransferase family 49 protein [Mycena sanguinolenta]